MLFKLSVFIYCFQAMFPLPVNSFTIRYSQQHYVYDDSLGYYVEEKESIIDDFGITRKTEQYHFVNNNKIIIGKTTSFESKIYHHTYYLWLSKILSKELHIFSSVIINDDALTCLFDDTYQEVQFISDKNDFKIYFGEVSVLDSHVILVNQRKDYQNLNNFYIDIIAAAFENPNLTLQQLINCK